MSIFRLIILIFVMLVLPITQAAEIKKIDINIADIWTLAQGLYGIGPKKAAAIIKYREKNGPFKSLRDLDKVYGIGPKTIARNKDKIILIIPPSKSQTPALDK